MNQVIDSFTKDIDALEKHILFNQELKEVSALDSSILKYLRSYKKKEFEYKLVIITLYGILEKHVDKMMINFLENIETNIEYYNFIPEKIKNSHFSNSISLAAILDSKNYTKFDHLNKQQTIRNLSQCVSNELPYSINVDSFIINTGNLKHNRIAKTLNQIGLNLAEELKSYDHFDFASENTFNKIDKIVDLRNEIAHGNISTILDSSELMPLIGFLKKYFSSICESTNKYLNEIILEYNLGFKSYSLGKTVLFGKKIIGFTYKDKFRLNVGDKIIVKTNKNRIFESLVLEKRMNKNKCTVKLNKYLKEEYQYFIVKGSSCE